MELATSDKEAGRIEQSGRLRAIEPFVWIILGHVRNSGKDGEYVLRIRRRLQPSFWGKCKNNRHRPAYIQDRFKLNKHPTVDQLRQQHVAATMSLLVRVVET